MVHATQMIDANRREPETGTAAVLMVRRGETGALNFSKSRPYPLDADISADPLIDGMTDRCLGGGASKLTDDREQLDIADLWRKRWCVRQSHPPHEMRSASFGGRRVA